MFIQHLFVTIPFFLVATSGYSLARRRAKQPMTTAGVLIIGLALLFTGAARLSQQYHQHSFLRQLSVNDLEFVVVAHRRVSDPEAMMKIVAALNQSKWFSPHRKSTSAKSIYFALHTHKGGVYHYTVSKYLHGSAAVLRFDSGAAFVPDLDYALSFYLPRNVSQ